MKKVEKPSEVDVRVNPSCEVWWNGFRSGAGAELRLPFEEALKKAKEGSVTLLVNHKENDNAGAG